MKEKRERDLKVAVSKSHEDAVELVFHFLPTKERVSGKRPLDVFLDLDGGLISVGEPWMARE